MKAFYQFITIFYNKEILCNRRTNFQLADEIPEKSIKYGSWDLLEWAYHNCLTSDVAVETNRKGLRRFGHYDSLLPIATEKKNPEIDIVVVNEYAEAQVSIQQILEYHDGRKAIQYLKERGLTVCPIGGK